MNTNWKVIKLGGTSQTKIGYDNLISLIKTEKTFNFAVVLSAISGVTNLLELYTKTLNIDYLTEVKKKNLNLIKELNIDSDEDLYTKINEIYSVHYSVSISEDDCIYEKSKIIGLGEYYTTLILNNYFKKCEIYDVQFMSSYDFIKSKRETFKMYQNVEFEANLSDFNNKYIKDTRIIICQGFIASTPNNNKILLGRGGSDTTGSLLANMLSAVEYQVWTDVNGFFVVDPKIVKNPKKVTNINYELSQEFSSFGAKIMHPYSIQPCYIKNIPIYVKNTYDLSGGFTIINNEPSSDSNIYFAVQNNITLFKIFSLNMWNAYGFTAEIFRNFEKIGIDVNIITTSQFSIYVTTDEKNILKIRQALYELSMQYSTTIMEDRSIVSLISSNIKKYISKIDYENIKTDIIHISSNQMTINLVVDKQDAVQIIEKFYSTFI